MNDISQPSDFATNTQIIIASKSLDKKRVLALTELLARSGKGRR